MSIIHGSAIVLKFTNVIHALEIDNKPHRGVVEKEIYFIYLFYI